MASVYPKQYTNPETFRRLRRDLLLEWLRPASAYLERRGLELPSPGSDAPVDYERLAAIFMEPTADMPAKLVDSIFLIHGMASPQGMEVLIDGAQAHGLDLGLEQGLTPADVALRMWLLNPQLLEQLHNSHELARPRSFCYFATDADPVPRFAGATAAQIAAIEERLNSFYVAWGRGKGARVFARFMPGGKAHAGDEWWFLIRHGGACRREGAMENGEPTSVFYRPQKYDLLKYAAARGEMGVNCCSDRERRALLRAFGLCLFGQSDFFPGTAKYTLRPLLEGRSCLACGDIRGIASAQLTEVHFYNREEPWHMLIRKADDIYALIERGELKWPERLEEIVRATFKVWFWGAKRARRLTIVPCNKALYGRDSDSGLLEKLLRARGFIQDCAEDESLSDTTCGGPGAEQPPGSPPPERGDEDERRTGV
jgi:hypothetical protein